MEDFCTKMKAEWLKQPLLTATRNLSAVPHEQTSRQRALDPLDQKGFASELAAFQDGVLESTQIGLKFTPADEELVNFTQFIPPSYSAEGRLP